MSIITEKPDLSVVTAVTLTGALTSIATVQLALVGTVKTLSVSTIVASAGASSLISFPAGTVPPTFLPTAGPTMFAIPVLTNTTTWAMGSLNILANGGVTISAALNPTTTFTSGNVVGIGSTAGTATSVGTATVSYV
jgi:hypothetical protein